MALVGRPTTKRVECSVAGCSVVAVARGWCRKHYHRWQRHGDPTIVLRESGGWGTNRGQACSVDGCEKPATSRTWCDMHYTRWLRHGDVESLNYRTGPLSDATKAKISAEHKQNVPKAEAHHAWRGSDLTYRGAHTRVRLLRGLATDHECKECGAPAAHWAYSHEPVDPGLVRTGAVSRGGRMWLVPYSSNADDYVALCVSCHTRLDLAHAG